MVIFEVEANEKTHQLLSKVAEKGQTTEHSYRIKTRWVKEVVTMYIGIRR